ncbi:MAG: ribosome maturation factor RimP [Gammaproteobacteria bacterium]|nr:ribosome maturation factor RimP [Gammaproteobacteria bacterium]
MKHETWDVLQPTIEGLGYEFVGVEYVGQAGRNTLRIYIDTAAGVTLEDCEVVSHHISGLLDVEDLIGGTYDLEVSSPGLDRPLFKIVDFERFVGQRVKIRLATPADGRRNFAGQLLGVENDHICIEVDGQIFKLDYKQIERARLVPQY